MMSVQTVCLAMLQLGDATGYEIRKCVSEGHFSHCTEASYGSIYPALNKLEAEGLLSARTEEQEGKPNRRVYTITDAGRRALADALLQPTRADTYRSDFLFLAMFAEYLPRATVAAALDGQVSRLVGQLEAIDESRPCAPLASASWVADCGRACLQAQLDYLYDHRDQLLDLADTSSITKVPGGCQPAHAVAAE